MDISKKRIIVIAKYSILTFFSLKFTLAGH